MQASTPVCDAQLAVASPHGSGAPTAVTAMVAGPENVRSSPSGARNASVSGKRKESRGLPFRSTMARSFVGACTQETFPAPTPGALSQAWMRDVVAPTVHEFAVRKTTCAWPPVGRKTTVTT